MKKTTKAGIVVIAGLAIMYACTSKKWEDIKPPQPVPVGCGDTTKTVSFAADLQPIFAKSCGSTDTTGSCHGPNFYNGGVDLNDYTLTKGSVDGGQIPQCINGDPNQSQMPLSPYTLDACDKATIIRWVNQGAANN